jgi:DNA polymerase-4
MSTLLYAEVPFFYAEIERAGHAALGDRPVIVGGDPRKRGLVQSATPDAIAAGVAPGMTLLEALERCPRARAFRTDMRRYREVAELLRACFREISANVEPSGLDAAWLDVSAQGEEPRVLAERLAARVAAELRLPLRAGIAPLKFLARLAAEEAPPGGVRAIAAGEEAAFLAPLPVERLPGVGEKTAKALAELGARRVGDLLRLERASVERALGNHGLRVLEYARGLDASPVRGGRLPRSLSQESTFDAGQVDLGQVWDRLRELALGLETKLRRQGLRARRVALKVRYADHETVTRTRTLPRPVARAGEIQDRAAELLDRTQAGTRPIRLVGISLGLLSAGGPDDPQLELFR